MPTVWVLRRYHILTAAVVPSIVATVTFITACLFATIGRPAFLHILYILVHAFSAVVACLLLPVVGDFDFVLPFILFGVGLVLPVDYGLTSSIHDNACVAFGSAVCCWFLCW